MVRSAVAAFVLAVTVVGWPAFPALAGPRGACDRSCQEAYDEDRAACADDPDALDDRQECLSLTADALTACLGVCEDEGRPGRCTLAVECVQECRLERDRAATGCRNRFTRRIRRECRQVLQDRCSSCLSSARAARRECRQACRGATPTTAVTVTTLGARSRSACQQRCIDAVVGDCYAECWDRCEGDPDALSVCRTACRNFSCETLERRCTSTGTASSAAYEQCCASNPAFCEDDPGAGDEAALCRTTTTRPRPTTTTTTTTGSTTTTTSTLP